MEASPPSVIYRARRFVRRYRRGLQIVAAVASLLTATTAFSVWEAIRARRAQADALAAEQAARTEAAKSKQVAKFLEDVLVGVTPTVAQGRDTTILREILDRTESRLDRELADQPEVRAEIYSTLGNAYFHFQSSKAVELQRKALALRRALFKGDNSAVADSLYRLADALQTYPESVPLAKECVAMRQRLSGDSEDTANALTLLGMVLRIQKRYSEAETFLRRGLDMETRLKEQDSQQFTGTAGELGEVLWFEGKRAEGLALTRQYLTMIRSVAPASIEYPLRHLTWELQSEGELLEAKAAANELLTLVTKIYPESNPRKIWNMGVLAGICNDLGEYGDAERLGRQRLEDTRKHLTANPTEAASDLDMAEPMTVLAQILTNQQKYAEAESLYRDALDESRRASPPDDEAIAWNQIHWAILLSAERKFDQAEPMLRQGLAYCRKLEPVNQYDVAWSTTSLANALSDQGKYAEADPLFREASQIFRAVTGAGNPGREWNTTCFANSLLREDNYAQSEPLFREALAAERQTHQGQTVQTRLTAQGLADLLTRTDRAAEAAELEKEFGLTSPATKPAAIRPLSTAPTPSPNEFN